MKSLLYEIKNPCKTCIVIPMCIARLSKIKCPSIILFNQKENCPYLKAYLNVVPSIYSQRIEKVRRVFGLTDF